MRLPWTLELIRDMRRFMDVPSVLRLRNYLVRVGKTGGRANTRLTLNMRSPIQGRIFLRERGSDIRTFKEVLEEQVYGGVLARLPACRDAQHIGHVSAFRTDRRQRVLAVAPLLPVAVTRAPVRMVDRCSRGF